jgi:hypothetical protein
MLRGWVLRCGSFAGHRGAVAGLLAAGLRLLCGDGSSSLLAFGPCLRSDCLVLFERETATHAGLLWPG